MNEIELKRNIMDWYPFAPNSTILTIEDTLEDVGEQQYDYVVLIGTIDKNPEDQVMEYAKKHLKQAGKILMVIHNKIGIKNYCEKRANQTQQPKFNRKQIETLLKKHDVNYYKFYYPLPDYETTNVIFTDSFLPNPETLARNISLHENEDIVFQSENKLFLDLWEQDASLFTLFVNSYFIECSTTDIPDNQIKFVSFSNMRKPEYRIKTIIQGDKVYKTARNEQARKHIEDLKKNIEILNELGLQTLDTFEDEVIISQYQNDIPNLEDKISSQIKKGQKEEAIQLMLRFFQEIKEKLTIAKTQKNIFKEWDIPYQSKHIETLTFVRYGLWDLIFQNAFYLNGQFFFYDQEWREEGIPVEYIFYRAIYYTKILRGIPEREEIWKQLGITNEQLTLFMALDDKLQEKIRSEWIWIKHRQGKNIESMEAEIEQSQQEKEKILDDCKKLLNEKDARIKFLEDNMDTTVKLLQQKESEVLQKENKILEMENSMSWKVTKPLRKLREKGESDEN